MTALIKRLHTGMPGFPMVRSTANGLTPFWEAALVTGAYPLAVDSITREGAVATAVISAGHPWQVDDVVAISGAAQPAWNTEFRVTARTQSTLQWEIPTSAPAVATGVLECRYAPLGWTLEYGGSNEPVQAFRAPGGLRYYLRKDDMDLLFTRVMLYRAMSNRDTGTSKTPIGGPGDASIAIWPKCQTYGYDRQAWIFGDDRTLIFVIFWYLGADTVCTPFYCGEFDSNLVGDQFAVVLSGFTTEYLGSSSYMANHVLASPGSNQWSYMPSDFRGNDTVIKPYIEWPFGCRSGDNGLLYPNEVDETLYIDRLSLFEGNVGGERVFRGQFRGLWGIGNAVKGGLETGSIHEDFDQLPGRKLLFLPSAGSASSPGGFFVDITGPW